MFDKAEMMEWEQQPINIKTDYDLAKNHFELKVKVHNTYIQNSSSGTAGRNKYESANNMADIGNEIKDYIAKMASASITNGDIVANMHEADKKKDSEMAEPLPNLPLEASKTWRTMTPTRTVVAAVESSNR